MRTERALGRLATNACVALQDIEELQDAGKHMGSRLAEVFGAVTAIHADDIHLVDEKRDKGKLVDGTITASKVTYSLPDQSSAIVLAKVFQVLLRTPRLEDASTAVSFIDEQGRHKVEVTKLNEFKIRVLGSAVSELIAQEDRRREVSVNLPPYKRSLRLWKNQGETFPPDIESRLVAVADAYTAMKPHLTATYRDRDGLQPAIHDESLGTEPAAMFEGTRKLFNGLIHNIRGDSRKNQEQNPNKKKRLLIEEGVRLKRDPSDPNMPWHGPGNPRAIRFSEHVKEAIHEAIEKSHGRKAHAIATVLAKLGGVGFSTVFEIGLHFGPDIATAGIWIFRDRREWKRRKQQAINHAKRIDTVRQKLAAEHARHPEA
jgi:hypothetical protein